MFKPNYENIVSCAKNIKPERIPLYEHIVDIDVIEKISGQPLKKHLNGEERDLNRYFQGYCNFYKDNGYDTVSYEYCVTDILPYGGALSNKITNPYITDEEKFNNYPWNDVFDLYVRNAAPYFDALKNNMPEGMRAVGGVGNGVFEVVQDLTGYENLCLMSFDNEKLYHAVFQKAGELLFRIWEWFLANYADVYCVCRFGDDLGFKSNTLLSPDDISENIFPVYKKIVQIVHGYGKPFLLHSCGCIFSIMDELIDEVHIDAKHSNEDQIALMSRWVNSYGSRIGNFGGIDTDAYVRMSDADLKEYVTQIYKLAEQKEGGFAIGSGNSIPAYVNTEKFLLVNQTIRNLRGD